MLERATAVSLNTHIHTLLKMCNNKRMATQQPHEELFWMRFFYSFSARLIPGFLRIAEDFFCVCVWLGSIPILRQQPAAADCATCDAPNATNGMHIQESLEMYLDSGSSTRSLFVSVSRATCATLFTCTTTTTSFARRKTPSTH